MFSLKLMVPSVLAILCSEESLALLPRSLFNKSKSLIPDYYVKEVRPPTLHGKPVEVDFSMRVVDINSINVEDMDFRMDMFIRQDWIDARLKIPEEMFEYGDDSVTLPSQYFENIWQPDLYFLNSKVVEIATLTHKFSSVTLYRNKTIRYSARMHAIVACQMEFQHYPMDTQVCPISIESFSYNKDKMNLKWAGSGVSVSPELKLLQYNILPLQLKQQYVYAGEKNGNFSRLVVNFRFERQIGHHLIQTFAPSTLVVVLSWFSFWLGLDAVPGRVTLLVTCLLTLVTMFTGLRSDIPAVAYIKALDLWMAGCMVAVFAAFGEFVIVKVLHGKYQDKKRKLYDQAMEEIWRTRDDSQMLYFSFIYSNYLHSSVYVVLLQESAKTPWTRNSTLDVSRRRHSQPLIPLYWKNEKGKEKILWQKIDKISRIVFPVLFFCYSLVYWTILLFGRTPILLN